ncbi:MAG: hypothetical protein GX596_13795 [Propionibacterium sp.]|nr:hypothetical protein [Propionibacterium sp.]
MINDPLERRRAEQAMVEGGHTFHLDPPKDVQVSVDDRGAVEWVLS